MYSGADARYIARGGCYAHRSKLNASKASISGAQQNGLDACEMMAGLVHDTANRIGEKHHFSFKHSVVSVNF